MYPKQHIFYGAIFSLLIWIVAPNLNYTYIITIFLASVLIDIDHYTLAVTKTKKISLQSALNFYDKLEEKIRRNHKKGLRKREPFHPLHTVEFHILIAIISLFSSYFFFIFIGMVFHSLLDIIDLVSQDMLYLREYFFFNWLRSK